MNPVTTVMRMNGIDPWPKTAEAIWEIAGLMGVFSATARPPSVSCPGEHEDGDHHRRRDHPQHRQGRRRVAGLGPTEHGHAVGDRLDARQRRATGGEGTHQEERAGEPGQAVGVTGGGNQVVGRSRRNPQRAGRHLREADDDHEPDGQHVHVGGHGEGATGLAGSAQVQGRQDHDEADRDRHLVARQRGHGGRDVVRTRRDRDRDGENVVHQEGRGHEQTPGAAEVRGDDLVVAAAGGVGVNGLPVGSHDNREDERDNGADPHGLQGRHGPGQRKGEKHLVGSVGDRRQSVGGEDRQSDTFGQKLVTHRVRSHRAPNEHALRIGQQVRHSV